MAKKETIITDKPSIKEVESNLDENKVYMILFHGSEVEVSGNVANILIKRGKATLIK